MAYNIYTSDNFFADFRRIFDQDVQPRMLEFDNERLSKIRLGVFLSILLLLLAIKIPLFVPLILIILYWLVTIYLYEFQSNRYIPVLVRLIPFFSYYNISVLALEDLTYSRLFPKTLSSNSLLSFHFFDSFSGEINRVHVDVSKFIYSYLQRSSALCVFSGSVIRLRTKTYAQGITVLRPRYSKYYNISDLVNDDFQKVNVKDLVFASQYAIYSNNVQEAETLLSEKFIKSFTSFVKTAKAPIAYCAFCGNYMYIALTIDSGFTFSNIFKSLKDDSAYEQIYNTFHSIIDLVNELYVIEDNKPNNPPS